jgi:serine/threonine protein kinase
LGIWNTQEVAIKIMKNKIGEQEKKNEVFEKEIQFISKLRHKNIISFYGFMTQPNYGIILEYCKF